MKNETLTQTQIEFILRQNLPIASIRMANKFYEEHGTWGTPLGNYQERYEGPVVLTCKRFFPGIYAKQPELKELEPAIFTNIKKHRYFERHIASIWADKLQFKTVENLIFNKPFYGLLPDVRRTNFQDFIKNSIAFKEFLHPYVYQTIKSPKWSLDIIVFEVYLTCLSKIHVEDKMQEFFEIAKFYQKKTKSESLTRLFLKETTAKFKPSEELRKNLTEFLTPFLEHHHTLRGKFQKYLKTHYGAQKNNIFETTRIQPLMACTKWHHTVQFNFPKPYLVDYNNYTPVEADKIAVVFLDALNNLIRQHPKFLENKDEITANVGGDYKLRTIFVTTSKLEIFNIFSLYFKQIEELLPKILEHMQIRVKKDDIANVDFQKILTDSLTEDTLIKTLMPSQDRHQPHENIRGVKI